MQFKKYFTSILIASGVSLSVTCLPHSCTDWQSIPCASVIKESPLERAVAEAPVNSEVKQYDSAQIYKTL